MKLKKCEARKLFDKETWEEIDIGESFTCLYDCQVSCLDGILHFKFKDVWPKVFEDEAYKFKVCENGMVVMYEGKRHFYFNDSLPIAYKAFELSKKIRESDD